MGESNVVKLQGVIRGALIAGEKSGETVTTDVLLKAEPTLIAAWAAEKLARLIRQTRLAMSTTQDNPYQMFFEGFRSFDERLPMKLRRGGAKMTSLGSATITELRGNLRAQRDKASAKAQRTVKLIEEMAPYSKHARGLTVQRYCELRAAGVKPREVRNWVREHGDGSEV